MDTSAFSNNPSYWKNLTEDPTSRVKHINTKLHFIIPPYYFEDLTKSVKTMIGHKLNSFQEDLGGILAGHGDIAVMKPNNEVLFNFPESHIDVRGDFYVFNPSVGSQLTGIVNKKTSGYIGCLTHGLFNISLPKPFGMSMQSWSGSSANIHDEVVFTVIKVDFQSQVPFIQGTIEDVRPSVTPIVSPSKPKPTKINQDDSLLLEETVMEEDQLASEVLSNDIINKDVNTENAQPVKKAEKRKRKRNSGDPIGDTPMNKKTKSDSEEPVIDDENDHLVINLFAKVSETMAVTPSSKKSKKTSKNNLVETPTVTPVNKEAKKTCEELLRNIEKDLPETVTVTPINKKAKKTSKALSEDVKKNLVETPTVTPVNKKAKKTCEELLRNIEKDLPETVTVTPINKKAKKTSKEPSEDVEKDLIELKNSSEVNNMKTILKDAETPNTLNSAAKTIKSAKLSSKKNVFVVQRINESGAPSVGSFVVEKLNSSAVTSAKKRKQSKPSDEEVNNVCETPELSKSVSKSSKKKKPIKESEDNDDAMQEDEQERIIKELLESSLCKSPVKSTPKLKSQKLSRKSLPATVKKEKDDEINDVNLKVRQIMKQVQENDKSKDKSKRSKKRSI